MYKIDFFILLDKVAHAHAGISNSRKHVWQANIFRCTRIENNKSNTVSILALFTVLQRFEKNLKYNRLRWLDTVKKEM